MSDIDWQEVAKGMGSTDKERLAIWMIQTGFSTGHGDTLDDLLYELKWQVAELRKVIGSDAHEIGNYRRLITELADALEETFGPKGTPTDRYTWTLMQRAREAAKYA